MRRYAAFIPLALMLVLAALPARAQAPVIACAVIRELPHDSGTSTQGFFIRDGVFYESSGGYNKSFLIKSDPDTGRALLTHPVDTNYFAEGIAPFKDGLRLLTWQSGTGFVHSLDSLRPSSHFPYRGRGLYHEGWGLACDERFFIMSSGTATLRFHSPESFTLVKTLTVTDNGRPVAMLNELECVDGLIYANVWKSDAVKIIDPATGRVLATLDLSALRGRLSPDSGVANGIAYDAKAKRLYLTGKHWDKVFQIAVPSLPGLR
ncbi:MAG: glutaminyl-peptide cyclotransferase [Desulfovibrionaceae bacterium]|nr:glutaminyl-peptide cyclotransferase [Desulfovibrionaceae bacterium]